MRLRIIAVFILAASSLQAANPATLGLVVRHGETVPRDIRQEFEAETALGVATSLRDGNWILAWRDEANIIPSEAFDKLIVVAFKGDCTTVMPRFHARGGPLGWTSMSEGRILPFIGIDCDQVKTALKASDTWRHSLIPAGLLGRALGRVALHEIYHVLSERKHHDAEGLFKARYSAADLLEPAVQPLAVHQEIAGVPARP
jgi:hypothetical protein